MYNPNLLLREGVMGGELHRHWAFFIGIGLSSYHQTRAPPCTTLDHHWGRPETRMTPRGKGDASGALGDHGSSSGGRLTSASPAEGLPPGGTLLRATRGDASLPAPLLQPPVRSSWRKVGRRAGAAIRRCDLILLRPMVSVSLLLRD